MDDLQHPPPVDIDPLAKVRNADGTVDWLAVGEAEQAQRCGYATQEMTNLLDWLHEHNGTFYVAKAAQLFHEHVQSANRLHSRRVRPVLRMRRATPRRRGCRRPRAQATRSSVRSGDSGSDDDGEPVPARLKLAPPPSAIYQFACISAADRGEVAS